MIGQEYYPHVEHWLVAYHEHNRLSRLIQTNSAGMAQIKLPKSRLNRTSSRSEEPPSAY